MPVPNNTLGTATYLNVNGPLAPLSDQVSAGSGNDYYRVQLSGRSSLQVTLNGLSEDANLELLNSAGSVVTQSTNGGTLAETFNPPDLAAGTYYIRISTTAPTAHYTLTLQAQSDSEPTLVWRNYTSGGNVIWRMDGTTLMSEVAPLAVPNLDWRIDGVGDFNRDGLSDLVWRHATSGDTVLWLMNSADQVSSTLALPTLADSAWQIQGTGDFTNDGDTDILWRNSSTGSNAVWQMNGTTLVNSLPLLSVVGADWQMQGTGDFNQDGKTDILWRNSTVGSNVVWLMNGTTLLADVALPIVVGAAWQIQGSGDFNKDGKADILWRNYSSGDTVIWMMNGTTHTSTVDFPATEQTNWRIEGVGSRALTPPTQDEAGNTPASAFHVGTLNANGVYAGVINPQDLSDYYRFTLAQASVIGVRLEGLNADLTVGLMDLATSQTWRNAQTGTTAEQVQQLLNPGTYYVKVEGATSSVSSGYVLKLFLDAAPPAPTGLAVLNHPTPVTPDTTPTLTGYAQAGSVVSLFANEQPVGTATVDSQGVWSLTTPELAEGDYRFKALATNSQGFYSAFSSVLALTIDIDTEPPVLVAGLAVDTAMSTTTQADHVTADPTITGTVFDASAISRLEAAFGTTLPTTWVNCTSQLDAAGHFTFNLAQLNAIKGSALVDGTYTLWLRAADSEHHVSDPLSLTFTLDTQVAAPSNLQVISTAGSFASLAGQAEAGTLIQLFQQGQPLAQTVTAANGTWQLTVSGLSLGTTQFTATATDAAGNVSQASQPLVVTLGATAAFVLLATALDTAPLTPTSRIAGQVDLAAVDLNSLRYQFDGTGTARPIPVTANGLFNQLVDLTNVSAGSHTLTITGEDLAGNLLSFTTTVTVDLAGGSVASAPLLLANLLRDTATGDTINTDGITRNPAIAGIVSSSLALGGLAVSFEQTGESFLEIPAELGSDGSFTLTPELLAAAYGGTLPDGQYLLRLRATDSADGISNEALISFTLDTTAPDLNVPSLIDGIAWLAGQESLAGTLTDFDPGTTVTYYFDGISSSATSVPLDAVGAFTSPLPLPEGFGSHTLNVIATDPAGNHQDLKYTFLMKPPQVAVDDETLDATGGNNGGNPGNSGNAYQWSSASGSGGGGGIWGYGEGVVLYGGGMGQESDPLGTLGAPNTPYENPGSGYGSDTPPTYVEKLAIILDQAVASIDTNQNLNRKAVLKHRAALLMEIGDLTQQGGFYNRMAPALYGIYDLANNHPISTRGAATAAGVTLAGQIIADTDAVKVEVYNAALLAAVNSAFVEEQYNFTAADQIEYRRMAEALTELSRTYAALNPTAPEDQATSTTPDFLDSLWRAQKTVNNEPLSITDIRMEMQRGVRAIRDLLEGVENPLRAIQFVNHLIQAATNVESLKDDIHDAKFLRELVEFGFEFAKLNPTGTAIAGSDAINTFLDTFWQGGSIRQAQGGLSEFFDGFDSKEQRIRLLNFEDNLLKANGLLQGAGLQDQKHDVNFIGSLVGLGSAYAALNPQPLAAGAQEQNLELFLNTLLQGQNIQEGAEILASFLNQYNGNDQQLLDISRKFLQVLDSIPNSYVEEESHDPSVIGNWLNEAIFYTNLRLNLASGESIFDASGFYEKIWQASTTQELHSVGNEISNYVMPDDIQIASTSTDGLIAQAEIDNGLGQLVGGVIILGAGAIYLIVDTGGKIIRAVFHSNDGQDTRTDAEKKTDEAVEGILEGATVKNQKKGIYEKVGDFPEANKDFDKAAKKVDQQPKTQAGGGRSIDLPDGGTAGVYPKSTSDKEPTIQINLSRGRGRGKRLKVRYKGRSASIIIPVS